MLGFGGWLSTDCLNNEGKNLGPGGIAKLTRVIVGDVEARHGNVIVDDSGVSGNKQEDKGLTRTQIAILDSLADYIGEKLGSNGGSDLFRGGLVVIDRIPRGKDFRS